MSTLQDKASERQPRRSLAAQLAAYFRERPGVWIDGRVLAKVAGFYAFRSRVSDIRRPPFRMNVINRQRHVRGTDGRAFTVSEYAFVAEDRTAEASAADDASTSPAAV